MQNNNRCFIYLWDKLVGEMILVDNEIYFKYDNNFKIEISPLELPIGKTQYSFNHSKYQHQHCVAGVFADSLPDSFGMKIIENYFLKEDSRFIPNVIDKLLFVGDVSLGALRYQPSIDALTKENIPLKLKDMKLHKKNILNKNTYNSIREAIDMYKSFSPAGGAKQKMILSWDKKTNTFYTRKAKNDEISLILKIDESEIPNDAREAITEYVYSLTAKECGIDIPKTYLLKDEDNYTHFAIERFDIDENKERLHIHTLSGLLNLEKSTRIDYIDVMNIAKQYLKLSHTDIVELYRRMIFNYIYNNCDDHLKNTSFIMDKNGIWKLSPAYDLTYNNRIGQRDMMLTINQKLSTVLTVIDFKDIALKFNIDDYQDIIQRVEKSVDFFKYQLDNYMDDRFKYDKLELLSVNYVFDV